MVRIGFQSHCAFAAVVLTIITFDAIITQPSA